jgi:predicted phage tail protein
MGVVAMGALMLLSGISKLLPGKARGGSAMDAKQELSRLGFASSEGKTEIAYN